jgi:hypothetical protein
MRGSIVCTAHQILLGWSDQGHKMGGACSAHGEDEKYVQNTGWKA